MPPSVSADHGLRPPAKPTRTTVVFHHSLLDRSRQRRARLEHFDLFKVDVADDRPVAEHGERPDGSASEADPADGRARQTRCRGRGGAGRRPTTSFLTATTLIYAIGAGITAGAGTRLVLRSILARAFASRSFRTPDPAKGPRLVSSRHYLPPVRIG